MLFYVRYGCDNDKNYLIVESENEVQVYDRFMGEADDCFDSVDCGVYEEDYNSLMESLYLAGIPGMYESIVEGANTKLEDCEKIEWK